MLAYCVLKDKKDQKIQRHDQTFWLIEGNCLNSENRFDPFFKAPFNSAPRPLCVLLVLQDLLLVTRHPHRLHHAGVARQMDPP